VAAVKDLAAPWAERVVSAVLAAVTKMAARAAMGLRGAEVRTARVLTKEATAEAWAEPWAERSAAL
jgi:hypothetical protein